MIVQVQPQLWQKKAFWNLLKAKKNITNEDSDDENEMNNGAPSLTSCEIKNVLKSATETSRNITARVIERDTSGEIYYFLEDSRGFRTRQHGHQ
ncbi:hypothetical protein TNCV_1488151 [Trichonephila clavipes]|nr:hypothetical protein TNCV_1488151 [Trichonephila clavipes]